MHPLVRIAVAAAVVLSLGAGGAAVAGARAGKKASAKRGAKHKRGGKRHRSYAPPQMPQTLELLDLDLVTGHAHVVAVGTTRVPDARLFVLTDDRGRRFVPELAECAAPPGVNVPPEALSPDEPSDPLEPSADGASEPAAVGASAHSADPAATGALAPINTRWRCTITVARLYRKAPLTGVGMEWGPRFVEVPPKQVAAVWKKARAAAPEVVVAHSPSPPAPPPRPQLASPPNLPEDPIEEETPGEPTRDVAATVE